MGIHSNYEQECVFHYGMNICMLNAGMSSVTSSMSVNNEKLFPLMKMSYGVRS